MIYRLKKSYPEHVGILEVSLGVTLLGMDEVGEFSRIPDEEDRGVVEHPIEIALVRPNLDRKT